MLSQCRCDMTPIESTHQIPPADSNRPGVGLSQTCQGRHPGSHGRHGMDPPGGAGPVHVLIEAGYEISDSMQRLDGVVIDIALADLTVRARAALKSYLNFATEHADRLSMERIHRDLFEIEKLVLRIREKALSGMENDFPLVAPDRIDVSA